MTEIPLIAYPSRKFQIILDGQDCTIKIYQKWNNVYLDLTVNTTPVAIGAICLLATSIVLHAQSVFRGYLFFIDMDGKEAPQWSDLGTRWRLLYYSQSEEIPVNFEV